MLQITPIPTNPADLPALLGANMSTNHRVFVYDSSKPSGDPRICADMTLAQFFSGVNALVNAGTITGPRSDVVEAVTATVSGAAIAATSSHVTVTSADANHIVILPAPVVGKELVINVGATGFELRSSTPASIAINGGTGANAESAIPANSTIRATCISLTAWQVVSLTYRVQTQDALTDSTTGTPGTTLAAVTTFTPSVAWDGAAVFPSAADATAIAAAITSLTNTVASLAAQLAKVKVDMPRVLYVEAAA